MAFVVYLLCALASLLCALLLTRGYRATRMPLLFWGAACFYVLVLANALLFVDLVVFPEAIDLAILRTAVSLVAVVVLLYGLIWETQA